MSMQKTVSLTAVLILSALCLYGDSRINCKLANAQVESLIDAKAKQLKGEEYCQFRKYDQLDDVNRDGVEDFIVLFTIESPGGGNDHIDFMSVFLSSKDVMPITIETGRRGERDPVNISVEDGKIILETQEYLKADPMCCPSGKGKLIYKLNGNRLEQVK